MVRVFTILYACLMVMYCVEDQTPEVPVLPGYGPGSTKCSRGELAPPVGP